MMKAHATRTTCFAIISGIEDDLRALVHQTCDTLNIASFLPTDVRESANARWQKDNHSNALGHAEDDFELLNYIDFLDLSKILHTSIRSHSKVIAIDIEALARSFETLAPVRNRVCHTRPLEADDLLRCMDAAENILRLHGRSFPTLRRTLRSLRENPTSLLHVHIPSFWSPDSDIHHNLPLPEFDDTGFFGRDQDRKEVHRLLKSHYTISTIVGEGGVGKTALAQRCLYDLLDGQDHSFDMIVWVSLKSSSLTAHGVQEINNAITSVLGLLDFIATGLGAPSALGRTVDQLIDEICEYLSEYNVLVAIDNLETLHGHNLRSLLLKVPPNSKLLITSRIGLGEFETRYSLNPLDEPAAAALMRRFARFLSLDTIQSANTSLLNTYCKALFHNPLLIKWFVATIGRGADPARLLDRKSNRFQDALDFCCSRLFDQLSSTEWRITSTLAAAKRPLTFTELQFLCTGTESIEVESALASLHNSSLLKREALATGSFIYRISEPAAAHISARRPPAKGLYHSVNAKLAATRHLSEREQVTQAQHEFEVFSIRTASRDERIAAVDLRRALDKLRRDDIEGARESVRDSKRLMPTYAETYRISSLVETKAGETFRASEELDQAVQHQPESPIVRYTYAMFLMREMEDAESAIEHLNVALELRAGEPALVGARALALTRVGRYSEAATLYDSLLSEINDRPRRWRVSTRDQAAECYRRWASTDFANRDMERFKEHIDRAFSIVMDAVAADDHDDGTARRVGRIFQEALAHGVRFCDAEFVSGAVATAERLAERLPGRHIVVKDLERLREAMASYPKLLERVDELCRGELSRHDATDGRDQLTGRIAEIRRDKGFGFIKVRGQSRWFFHREDVVSRPEWHALDVGTSVTFFVGQNHKGPCAKRVRAGGVLENSIADDG